ncbi:hypothetical protein EAH87_14630 [Sphingomonas koreensis]|nr:hypothetical protein EAH87_14630 [Sphingomonas koreensis]
MLVQREAERDALLDRLGADPSSEVKILPHPALMRHFEQRVAAIREALNDPALRGEAAETIRSLIERVTIAIEDGEAVADIEASTASLIDFAQNAENPLRRSVGGCSVAVVAGTGFDLCRIRKPLRPTRVA